MTEGGPYYLWFSQAPPNLPIGVYDRPSDVIGISSVEIPKGKLGRLARTGTSLFRDATELIPGSALKWINRL